MKLIKNDTVQQQKNSSRQQPNITQTNNVRKNNVERQKQQVLKARSTNSVR